ncbi:MAG TPA: hypothetical protein VFA09_13130 [Ktedonobacteraceae bacterium]|nr:hypothetical protein [Ktedonobacteraceae bacterium]
MTRKDSEKDAERPHYYSQFWLDVAAGRRVIGGSKSEDGTESAEAELPEPIALRRAGRTSTAPTSDGHRETRSQSVVEPAFAPDEEEEEEMEPELEEPDLVAEEDELGIPNIDVDEMADDTEFPDLDLVTPEAEEDEEEDFFDEEDEEEEEDDWAIGRGRKKPKPGRQVKPPKPSKKPRREPRRGF